MVRFQGKSDIGTNGWELIKRDLGYNLNTGVVSHPYVILYNRYMGVMRVFVTVQKVQAAYQFAEVRLAFSDGGNYKAGTLNRIAALGVPLDGVMHLGANKGWWL